MELAFLASNDADHYRPGLELFHRQHQEFSWRLPDPGPRGESHRRQHAQVFRRESGLVETAGYARQCVVAEPGGDPHPCVQALLPETGVVEESEGVQDACLAEAIEVA